MAGVSQPSPQFSMVPGQDIDPLFLCPLCQDSWVDPVELEPCGDIFCQRCIDTARAQQAAQPMMKENLQCPMCKTVVQSQKKPNRMLLNAVMNIEVECQYCHWRGTRESSEQHTCAEADSVAEKHQSPTATENVQWFVSAASLAKRGSGVEEEQSPPSLLSKPGEKHCGPRRAQREIEDAYTPIGDDPTPTAPYAHSGPPSGQNVGTSLCHQQPDETAAVSRPYAVTSLLPVPSRSATASSSDERPSVGTRSGSGSHTHRPSGASSSPHRREPVQRHGLSQIDCDQLVGIFMMFDNETGQLNRTQLRNLCFCLNFVQRDDDISPIFLSMDRGSKGYVTQDDFIYWLSRHQPDRSSLFGLTQFEYIDALLQFRSVDPEYSGVIDERSFISLCQTYRHAQTPQQARDFFLLCDDRRTGYVSLRQFLQSLKLVKTRREERPGPAPPHASLSTTADGVVLPGPRPTTHTTRLSPSPQAAHPAHMKRANITGGAAPPFRTNTPKQPHRQIPATAPSTRPPSQRKENKSREECTLA